MKNNLILTSIPLEELTETIRDMFRAEMGNLKPSDPVELLTEKQASVFLGVSRPTLLKLRKEGVIVSLHIGTRIRYNKAELLKALEVHPMLKGRSNKKGVTI